MTEAGSAEPTFVPRESVAIELRCEGDAERLLRLPAFASLSIGRTRAAPARTVWHDRADGTLVAAGRVMAETREGGLPVWRTVQARPDGVTPWSPCTPEPVMAEQSVPDGVALVPIAVFEGRRRSLALAPGVLSGVALINGEIRVVTGRRPVLRLSVSGEPDAVFGFARRLLDDPATAHAIRLPALGLAGEALDMVGRPRPPAPPTLRAELTAAEAFAHVTGQLARVLMHYAPSVSGDAPEPVHQMRVALRRLRSAMSLFRGVVDDPLLERLRVDLRQLAKALGPARDWDVFLGGTGREIGRAVANEPAVARMLAAAERRRRAAYHELAGVLANPQFQHLLLRLAEKAAGPPSAAPEVAQPELVAYAREALQRRLRRVRQETGDLGDLAASELHAIRIQCKRLRYAAEFFAPLFPRRSRARDARRFLRRLATVQERLGRLNDGTVAASLMAELGRHGFAAGAVRGWLAAQGRDAQAKAARSWARFRDTEPFWVA